MGNSLRCCLACVLPCGALDVIRIVHLNGQVEEITGTILAREVLEANPNHVLTKPCRSSTQPLLHRILIISPQSHLKRGNIYFLIPSSSIPAKKRSCNINNIITSTAHSHQNKTASHSQRDRRSGSGRVRVWRPRLESISEDS